MGRLRTFSFLAKVAVSPLALLCIISLPSMLSSGVSRGLLSENSKNQDDGFAFKGLTLRTEKTHPLGACWPALHPPPPGVGPLIRVRVAGARVKPGRTQAFKACEMIEALEGR
jgi:hypothetical protein